MNEKHLVSISFIIFYVYILTFRRSFLISYVNLQILFSALYSSTGSCDGKDDLIGSDYIVPNAGGNGATFYNPCTFDPECTHEEEDNRIALGKFS